MKLLDWSGFLERVDHNQPLALELAEDLLMASGRRLAHLDEAFTSKDQRRIEQAAHALRGLLAPYGAAPLLASLKAVEEQARARSLDRDSLPSEIRDSVATLQDEVAKEVGLIRKALDTPGAKG